MFQLALKDPEKSYEDLLTGHPSRPLDEDFFRALFVEAVTGLDGLQVTDFVNILGRSGGRFNPFNYVTQ
jgi:hypothetical protein